MRSARRFVIAFAVLVFLWPRVAFAGCTSAVVPILGFGDSSQLNGISGSSASDIWAVGQGAPKYAPSDVLTEHFDGASWHVVPLHLFVRLNSLNAVAAFDSNDAWAVGTSQLPDGDSRDLLVHWNGSAWKTVWDPGNLAFNNWLGSIAVNPSDPDDLWVLGFSADQGIAHGFSRAKMLHWNGKGWRIFTFKWYNKGLSNLSIAPTGHAWAVGGVGSDPGYPVAYHWDGVSWTQQSVPGYGSLIAVIALSDDDVWAVGAGAHRALIEHYDGARWSTVQSPGDGSGVGLQSVSATSSSDVWAVGSRKRNDQFRTLMEHWDGTVWSIVPSSNPFMENLLTGVQALPGGALAVGYGRWANSPTQPISERASCTQRIR